MLDVGDLTLDEDETPLETSQVELVNESFDNGYTYDPQVASDELGLPLDLIDEFIQDFIAQSKEFKEKIYVALDDGEFDQVKILSHKLKGVAANLRIEDAFDVLSIVNTSEDTNILKKNLDIFYKIIAKLSGEEVLVEKVAQTPVVTEPSVSSEPELATKDEEIAEDDDLYGDLLDVDVKDSAVPEKIEIPELADDEFLNSEVDLENIESDIDTIENIELLELDKEIESTDDAMLDIDEEITLDLDDELISIEDPKTSVEYSKESVADEIGLDIESFNELFEDYLSESKTILSEMKNAVASGDYATCRHEAVKLQGMSDNMRVNSFSDELSLLTKSNDSVEIDQAIESLENAISEISRVGA